MRISFPALSSRSCRRVVRCATASAEVRDIAFYSNNRQCSRPRQPSLLRRISALVELQAAMQKFEVWACRGAMMGFVSTLSVEVLSGSPAFTMTMEQGQLMLATALLVLTASVTSALTRRRAAVSGGLMLEAVMSSLTCAQRSQASLTQAASPGFDHTVDKVLDAAFNSDMTTFLEVSCFLAEDTSCASPHRQLSTASLAASLAPRVAGC